MAYAMPQQTFYQATSGLGQLPTAPPGGLVVRAQPEFGTGAQAVPVYIPQSGGVDPRAKFDAFVRDREVNIQQADDLFGVLTSSRVVLLLDDSGSMRMGVAGRDGMQQGVTRWSELLRLAGCIVDIVSSVTPAGLDVFFLNRPGLFAVTDPAQLQPCFAMPPGGGTPLKTTLTGIFSRYNDEAAAGTRVLVIVVTDGEPSDCSVAELFNLLATRRHPNIHISLAECNDNEEEMAYLDGWDTQLQNFDNSDDYSLELARVRRAKGANFRFTYMDYAVKICLGSVMRKYFNLDQSSAAGGDRYGNSNGSDGCCSVM